MTTAIGMCIVACAAFLGGVTGFGYSLVATPSLVVAGFSLPFVITANFALGLVTRVSVAYRLRRHVEWRVAAMLVGASLPGLLLGAELVHALDPAILRIAVGSVVVIAGILMAGTTAHVQSHGIRGGAAIAGFVGGLIGGMSSLNGVAPVLFLARRSVPTRTLLGVLAVYFVASNAAALVVLAVARAFSTRALFPDVVVWLPAAVLANAAGVALAPRIPVKAFRRLTLGVVIAAGITTVVTARRW